MRLKLARLRQATRLRLATGLRLATRLKLGAGLELAAGLKLARRLGLLGVPRGRRLTLRATYGAMQRWRRPQRLPMTARLATRLRMSSPQRTRLRLALRTVRRLEAAQRMPQPTRWSRGPTQVLRLVRALLRARMWLQWALGRLVMSLLGGPMSPRVLSRPMGWLTAPAWMVPATSRSIPRRRTAAKRLLPRRMALTSL